MDERVAANRTHWNELARIHERPSAYHDVAAVRAGGISLRPLECRETSAPAVPMMYSLKATH